jgi:hypothetical protein
MKKILLSLMLVWIVLGVSAQIDDPFFEHVTYCGAFGYTDWTAGWANFDPQSTVYPATTTTINAGNITSNTTWSSSNSPVVGAASFSNSYLSNSFFEPVSFVGAFGSVDWTAGWSNFNPQNTSYPVPNVTIPAGTITTNTTWTSSNTYLLNGYVYIDSNVTLTIQPGTIIRGDKANKGTLIVKRGGKLIAQGTQAAPIIFTSNQGIGSRDYGDWGGVIVCGKAKNNQSNNVLIEGGVDAYYGGQDDEDNSGIIKYVRIEFCGIAFAPNNEINGLTMGSVGSGTTIDYVQVSYSGDDSYEWFGGKVNCKHLIAHRGWDDDFDTDFGFTGMIQFAVSLRDPNIADVSGSNGFESDNDASGSTLTPQTRPIFCNLSVFGPKVTSSTPIHSDFKRAMHIRRNSSLSVFNSIFCGWPTGLFIEGSLSQANATANTLRIENCVMSGMGTNFASTFEDTYYNTTSRHNQLFTNNTDLLLSDPFNLTSPNFLPTKNVYLLNGWVYVDSTYTLTIQPGTIIRGDKNNKGALIIKRGAMLNAIGNKNEPIIFTSNITPGSRASGDWGGVILCGKAQNNQGVNVLIEGGVTAYYGGNTNDDNSGTLKYVRIEFPGIAFAPNNEINGLTMGSVGSGTTIDYIQVSYSGDDSFEWFGGRVNAKHLIALKGLDDDFDTDFGYRGKLQFLVSMRDPSIADVSGSNGFESDNDAAGSTLTPTTHPTFCNVSLFGPLATPSTPFNSNFKRGEHLRRNTMCSLFNSVVAGWPVGLFIEGALTQSNATNDSLRIENVFMSGMGANFAATFDSTYFTSPARNNTKYANNSSLLVYDPFNQTSPNFLPMPGSPLLYGSKWVKTIQGNVKYENTPLTALNNVIVVCKDNAGNLISTDTTDAAGFYSLKSTDGIFNLTIDCPKAWGGVTLADVIRIRQHLAFILTMTALQQIAADVNESSSVALNDAILIRQRLAFISTPSWTSPDWVFETATVTISSGAGVTTKDIKGLCSGDANGSYVPPTY